MAAAPVLDARSTGPPTCPVCEKGYKQPRLLPCFHTVCGGCAERLVVDTTPQRQCACPVCDTRMYVTGSVSDDFPINHFIEADQVDQNQEIEKVNCSRCSKNKAQRYCGTCDETLCDTCVDIHQSFQGLSKHMLVDVGCARRIHRRQDCSEHADQVSVCGPQVEAAIEVLLKMTDDSIRSLEENVLHNKQYQEELECSKNAAVNAIRSAAERLCSVIETKRDDLIDNVLGTSSKEETRLKDRITQLEAQLKELDGVRVYAGQASSPDVEVARKIEARGQIDRKLKILDSMQKDKCVDMVRKSIFFRPSQTENKTREFLARFGEIETLFQGKCIEIDKEIVSQGKATGMCPSSDGSVWVSRIEAWVTTTELPSFLLQRNEVKERRYRFFVSLYSSDGILEADTEMKSLSIIMGFSNPLVWMGNRVLRPRIAGHVTDVITDLDSPVVAMATTRNGDIVVLYATHFQVYSGTGKLLSTVILNDEHDFSRVCRIACNINGDVCVADRQHRHVKILSEDGRLKTTWTLQDRIPIDVCCTPFGDVVVLTGCVNVSGWATVDSCGLDVLNRDGDLLRKIAIPASRATAMAVDGQGRIWIGKERGKCMRLRLV